MTLVQVLVNSSLVKAKGCFKSEHCSEHQRDYADILYPIKDAAESKINKAWALAKQKVGMPVKNSKETNFHCELTTLSCFQDLFVRKANISQVPSRASSQLGKPSIQSARYLDVGIPSACLDVDFSVTAEGEDVRLAPRNTVVPPFPTKISRSENQEAERKRLAQRLEAWCAYDWRVGLVLAPRRTRALAGKISPLISIDDTDVNDWDFHRTFSKTYYTGTTIVAKNEARTRIVHHLQPDLQIGGMLDSGIGHRKRPQKGDHLQPTRRHSPSMGYATLYNGLQPRGFFWNFVYRGESAPAVYSEEPLDSRELEEKVCEEVEATHPAFNLTLSPLDLIKNTLGMETPLSGRRARIDEPGFVLPGLGLVPNRSVVAAVQPADTPSEASAHEKRLLPHGDFSTQPTKLTQQAPEHAVKTAADLPSAASGGTVKTILTQPESITLQPIPGDELPRNTLGDSSGDRPQRGGSPSVAPLPGLGLPKQSERASLPITPPTRTTVFMVRTSGPGDLSYLSKRNEGAGRPAGHTQNNLPGNSQPVQARATNQAQLPQPPLVDDASPCYRTSARSTPLCPHPVRSRQVNVGVRLSLVAEIMSQREMREETERGDGRRGLSGLEWDTLWMRKFEQVSRDTQGNLG